MIERSGIFFAKISSDVIERLMKDGSSVSFHFRNPEVFGEQRYDLRRASRFRGVRCDDLVDGLSNDSLFESCAVGYPPAKLFGQQPKLVIHRLQLFVRPLKPAWPDKLVQEEESARFQGELNLTKQVFQVLDMVD